MKFMLDLSDEVGLKVDVPGTTRIKKSQLKFQICSYNFELYYHIVRKLGFQSDVSKGRQK